MNASIYSVEEVRDGKTVTVWYLEAHSAEVDLNKVIDNSIEECFWLDEDLGYAQADYSEWDGTEHIAIIDNHGQLVKKGIKSIEDLIKEHHLFITKIQVSNATLTSALKK